MRRRFATLIAFAALTLLAGTGSIRLGAATAELPDLNGTWKLLVLPFGEDEFAIVRIKDEGGKLSAEKVDTQAQIPGIDKGAKVERDGDALHLILGDGNTFTAASSAGPTDSRPARIFGVFHYRDNDYPARLERTDDAKVAQFVRPPILSRLKSDNRERDPQVRLKKLEKLAADYKQAPASAEIYRFLIPAAAAANADTGRVRKHVEDWLAEARPYGDAWVVQVQEKALAALRGLDPYAEVRQDVEKANKPLKLKLARAEDASLPAVAPLEQRARAATRLALAARAAGEAELASEAEGRAAKLNDELDAEYREKVPPFKPGEFAGRKDKAADRVVLLELFTGAQCPPCVAADVAFDALSESYQPAELIGLQYHLHVPGPDPLTNPDTIARARYYGPDARGTPSTLFNGKADAPGGGTMNGDSSRKPPIPSAEDKYKQYREVIDAALEGKKGAAIDLSAKRVGEEIRIVARAEANGDSRPSGLRLRLALVEEQVRYVGGNGLRFHHHVVRAMPGGPEGKALEDGKGQVEATVKLDDLRRTLETYLADSEKRQPFPNPLPPIELKGLSVVAFVQDDDDKSVLHAARAALDDSTAAKAP